MNRITNNDFYDNVPPEEKFNACHRNRGLGIYTFYAYWAKFQRNKKN